MVVRVAHLVEHAAVAQHRGPPGEVAVIEAGVVPPVAAKVRLVADVVVQVDVVERAQGAEEPGGVVGDAGGLRGQGGDERQPRARRPSAGRREGRGRVDPEAAGHRARGLPGDPHEGLFDHYEGALRSLAAGEPTEAVLRRFELALLREIGYAVELQFEAGRGTPLVAEERYAYWPERGPLALAAAPNAAGALELRGKTLLDMARGDFSDPLTAAESKQLMRWLIGQHLDQRTLNTRQLLIELQQL